MTQPDPITLCWFRQDLRIQDNPALFEAASTDFLPIYILEDEDAGEFKMGGASRWWCHHALQDLNQALGGKLSFYSGRAEAILKQLISAYSITRIVWNRCYEPWRILRDKQIKKMLQEQGIEVTTFNGSLLWEPWTVQKADGTPYKVFTPFYQRGCLAQTKPRTPLPSPDQLSAQRDPKFSVPLEELQLLPKIGWDSGFSDYWSPTEAAAHDRLVTFLDEQINSYQEGRNFPAKQSVSRLSPYLHFGQISPHQIWEATNQFAQEDNLSTFRSELGWREFSYYLLYHFPELPHKNWQNKFDRFPWNQDPKNLSAWQKGNTGIPLVDAGMRELWHTGYMHNRVRMVVASFLVKNLMIDWHEGERWFWDCLVDADLASNSASWQWVAGCGADAAPYFRIFNPVTQAEKFDPEGIYLRQWIPELKTLPNRYLAAPWTAPADVLINAHIELGKDYPYPIVDLKESRQRALAAYQKL